MTFTGISGLCLFSHGYKFCLRHEVWGSVFARNDVFSSILHFVYKAHGNPGYPRNLEISGIIVSSQYYIALAAKNE